MSDKKCEDYDWDELSELAIGVADDICLFDILDSAAEKWGAIEWERIPAGWWEWEGWNDIYGGHGDHGNCAWHHGMRDAIIDKYTRGWVLNDVQRFHDENLACDIEPWTWLYVIYTHYYETEVDHDENDET